MLVRLLECTVRVTKRSNHEEWESSLLVHQARTVNGVTESKHYLSESAIYDARYPGHGDAKSKHTDEA